mmetsp:Transcript_17472/g.54355  ORF Transcript_17472/g.54355 Transcript_17472/m.54355 type:complete len:321 (+) Transcript_17472:503-1465(+)
MVCVRGGGSGAVPAGGMTTLQLSGDRLLRPHGMAGPWSLGVRLRTPSAPSTACVPTGASPCESEAITAGTESVPGTLACAGAAAGGCAKTAAAETAASAAAWGAAEASGASAGASTAVSGAACAAGGWSAASEAGASTNMEGDMEGDMEGAGAAWSAAAAEDGGVGARAGGDAGGTSAGVGCSRATPRAMPGDKAAPAGVGRPALGVGRLRTAPGAACELLRATSAALGLCCPAAGVVDDAGVVDADDACDGPEECEAEGLAATLTAAAAAECSATSFIITQPWWMPRRRRRQQPPHAWPSCGAWAGGPRGWCPWRRPRR